MPGPTASFCACKDLLGRKVGVHEVAGQVRMHAGHSVEPCMQDKCTCMQDKCTCMQDKCTCMQDKCTCMQDKCTCMQDTALNHAEQLFAEGDVNGDGTLNCEEVIALMLKVSTPPTYWLPFDCLLLACSMPLSCLLVIF